MGIATRTGRTTSSSPRIVPTAPPAPKVVGQSSCSAPPPPKPKTAARISKNTKALRKARAKHILTFLREEKGSDEPARKMVIAVDPELAWTKRAAAVQLDEEPKKIEPRLATWSHTNLHCFEMWVKKTLSGWVEDGWPLSVEDQEEADFDNGSEERSANVASADSETGEGIVPRSPVVTESLPPPSPLRSESVSSPVPESPWRSDESAPDSPWRPDDEEEEEEDDGDSPVIDNLKKAVGTAVYIQPGDHDATAAATSSPPPPFGCANKNSGCGDHENDDDVKSKIQNVAQGIPQQFQSPPPLPNEYLPTGSNKPTQSQLEDHNSPSFVMPSIPFAIPTAPPATLSAALPAALPQVLPTVASTTSQTFIPSAIPAALLATPPPPPSQILPTIASTTGQSQAILIFPTEPLPSSVSPPNNYQVSKPSQSNPDQSSSGASLLPLPLPPSSPRPETSTSSTAGSSRQVQQQRVRTSPKDVYLNCIDEIKEKMAKRMEDRVKRVVGEPNEARALQQATKMNDEVGVGISTEEFLAKTKPSIQPHARVRQLNSVPARIPASPQKQSQDNNSHLTPPGKLSSSSTRNATVVRNQFFALPPPPSQTVHNNHGHPPQPEANFVGNRTKPATTAIVANPQSTGTISSTSKSLPPTHTTLPDRLMFCGVTPNVKDKVMDVYRSTRIEDTLLLVEQQRQQERARNYGNPVGVDREEDARWYKWWSARQHDKWEQQCYNDPNEKEARRLLKEKFKATCCDDDGDDGGGGDEFSGN